MFVCMFVCFHGPGHVVQGDLVLEELGELEYVLVGDGGTLRLHLLVEVYKIPGRKNLNN